MKNLIITGIRPEVAKYRELTLMVTAACSAADYNNLMDGRGEWPDKIFPCHAVEIKRRDGNGNKLLRTAYGTISECYVTTKNA